VSKEDDKKPKIMQINKPDSDLKPGDSIDVHNGVVVYFNGGVFHGDHWVGNYKLGQKYQCVEYVKRYYYQHLNHKMPNMWGHAVNFFNTNLQDGAFNADRGLVQYTNPSKSKPRPDDLLVYNLGDAYGHVSIISRVEENSIEVVQQNWGSTPRSTFKISSTNGVWKIENAQIIGWLRKN